LAGPAFGGALDRPGAVHHLLEGLGVVYVGGGEHHGEGDAVAVGQEVVLGAGFAAVGGVWPDRFAPLFAGTLAESKLALDQSTIPALANRSSSARCRRRQTPALCQSLSRRQQVTPLPKPISLGSYPPRDAALEDEDDAGEHGPVRYPRPTASGFGRFGR
jgi:hypothetical protein